MREAQTVDPHTRMSRTLGFVAPLMVLSACGGGSNPPSDETREQMEEASVSPEQPLDATASSEEPAGESVTLTVAGQSYDLTVVQSCAATPGRGLGAQWSSEDFVGDGSSGMGLAAGFERDRGRVTLTFSDRSWIAEEDGDLTFEQTDIRTAEGRSWVTVHAAGQAVSDGDRVPFELTVTCEPGGT